MLKSNRKEQNVRITEILKENKLLYTDNPGGKWLEKEIEKAKKFGTFAVGALTGHIGLRSKVEIKTDYIYKLRGANKEELRRDSDDQFDWLMNKVDLEGWHPDAVMVWVDYQGIAKIAEGNHRVAVAKARGIEWIPVDIRYFAGSENKSGPMNPKVLISKNLIRPV